MSVEQFKAIARDHLEKYLPNRAAELREQGTLEEELTGRAQLAQAEYERLMGQNYRDQEAFEVARQLVTPAPGPGDAPEDEQDRELAELEREYQANPGVVTDKDMEELSRSQ